MTVSPKSPIHHKAPRSQQRKKSPSAKSAAFGENFSRYAASTGGALDDYTRSMRQYLDNGDADLKPRNSREASPEFCWRDLGELPQIPDDALSSRNNSLNPVLQPSEGRRESRDSTAAQDQDQDQDHEQDDMADDHSTSSLSSHVSNLHISSNRHRTGRHDNRPQHDHHDFHHKKSSSKKYCVT